MAVIMVDKGEGLNTKGQADLSAARKVQESRNVDVIFRNLFGREVAISKYHADKKVRRGEGEIVRVIGQKVRRAPKKTEKKTK